LNFAPLECERLLVAKEMQADEFAPIGPQAGWRSVKPGGEGVVDSFQMARRM